ncbi:hypothetical protein ACFFP0_06040 [Rhizobium puerariae]|uniref:Uncharacterized protein n=1 Tax=Rhizobium puerariae TaxID=1585791 RepID=A0ABV6ACR0_9HYPH
MTFTPIRASVSDGPSFLFEDKFRAVQPCDHLGRRDPEITNGLIVSEAAMMQISGRIGRHRAHHMLHGAAQRSVMEGTPFTRAIAEHPDMAGFAMVDRDTAGCRRSRIARGQACRQALT